MLYVEVHPGAAGSAPLALGACVSSTRIQPSVPCPDDFDAFWKSKIESLHQVPIEAAVTPGESGIAGLDYAVVRLNNINGAHVYGQLAKPSAPGKYPAVLLMQWASPPYPLQKAWVTDLAAKGWLALNVEPHDVPCNLPSDFYAALPQMIKSYNTIYNDNRDRNYFLQMYLGDYRALDYLASRPDWDGRTLLVLGTSMGGQQSLCMAGLHPQVTHLIVHVPAGADSNGPLHGRAAGYPNWDSTNPQVMKTGLYFDTVNFAPRIKATCLISVGFVDTAVSPVGIWAEYNEIPGPKEIVPLVDAPHNNLATTEQQRPFMIRQEAWLTALAKGEQPVVKDFSADEKSVATH
jgi:cephalosporin-C deacetylase-like acetyl esterase